MMLGKYWRFHVQNMTGIVLTGANDGLIKIRFVPNKIASGVRTEGTVIEEDCGITGSAGTLASTESAEGDVQDNHTDLYWGGLGSFEVKTDDGAASGYFKLFLEFCDDNSSWPLDTVDFDVTDLIPIVTLPIEASIDDATRSVNFKVE